MWVGQWVGDYESKSKIQKKDVFVLGWGGGGRGAGVSDFLL